MNGGKSAKYGHHFEIKYFLFRLFYVIRQKEEGELVGFDMEYRPSNNPKLPEIDFCLKLKHREKGKSVVVKNYYEVKSGKETLDKNEVIKTIKNFYQIDSNDTNTTFNLCYQHNTRGYLTLIPFLAYRWKDSPFILKGKNEVHKGIVAEICKNLSDPDKKYYKKIKKSFFEKVNLVPIDRKIDYEYLTRLILKEAFEDVSVKNEDDNIQNFYNATFKDMFNYVDKAKDENYSEGLDYFLLDKQPILKMIINHEGLCQNLILKLDNKVNYTES